ncbi:MAG: leucine-rich repeat domain-containing protein [Armatimonadetes bacterium]|nr:leucine-rich repeat domain-containing protein [Armatimonadota bacterium]
MPDEISSLTPDQIAESRIAESRIAEALHAKSESLDLSGLGLTKVPLSVGQLTQLGKLSLSGNQLRELPVVISQLTQLQTLDLNGNKFEELPTFIGQLTQLRNLSLSGNQLRELPVAISQLTQLQALNLSGNKLNKLPAVIGRLVRLRTLNLIITPLSELPATIGELTRLENLLLIGTRLTELPIGIGQLTRLQQLFLDGNRLKEFPAAIVQLAQLRTLSLTNTQLTELPADISQLTQLQTLYLDGNQLSELPTTIGHLTKLEQLVLEDNRLSNLPEELSTLSKLTRLFLHGNNLLGLPAEILGPRLREMESKKSQRVRASDILDYYFKTRKAGRPLNEVKLLLVGRGSAGKTSIIRRLRENKFSPGQRETSGITIKPWPIKIGKDKVHVHVWDFAGQVITHATHQFFLTQRSVYILVLTGRENSEKTDAEYWLRLIRAFATEERGGANTEPITAPVLIVLNKCRGKSPCRIDQNALREKYPFIVDFVDTDCKTGTGIRILKRQLLETIRQMPTVREAFPMAWFAIKEKLSKMECDYLMYPQYRALCEQHGVKDQEDQDRLARALHRLGVALNYSEDQRLRETTVLNPQWVTNGIYSILRHAVNPTHPEETLMSDVERVLPKERPEMRRFLIELMRRFELVFPLTEEGERWLVPQRLADSQPPLGSEWTSKDVTRVRFRYTALPEGLLPRFITRTYPLSDDQPRWLNGVILADDHARALVRADPAERLVTIAVIGPADARQGLAAVVRAELKRIHTDIKGLDPAEEMELADQPGVYVSTDTLVADEKAGRKSSASTKFGTIEVNSKNELNRVSSPAARDQKRIRPRLFISYSSSDSKLRDEFVMRLKTLEAHGLLKSWSDRCLIVGEDWDHRIKEELEKADFVVFLVSAKFEATDYINDVEVSRACERADKGECQILPIILEECDWKNGRLSKYTALPAKALPIRDTKPQRKAWQAVQQSLRTLLEQESTNLSRALTDDDFPDLIN